MRSQGDPGSSGGPCASQGALPCGTQGPTLAAQRSVAGALWTPGCGPGGWAMYPERGWSGWCWVVQTAGSSRAFLGVKTRYSIHKPKNPVSAGSLVTTKDHSWGWLTLIGGCYQRCPPGIPHRFGAMMPVKPQVTVTNAYMLHPR